LIAKYKKVRLDLANYKLKAMVKDTIKYSRENSNLYHVNYNKQVNNFKEEDLPYHFQIPIFRDFPKKITYFLLKILQ
jgi:hypothetical protein